MKLSDLQSKKIISISSGRNIGNIIDADVTKDGKIDSFIIEQNRGLFLLNRESESRIYWDDITKIGEDVILIKKE